MNETETKSTAPDVPATPAHGPLTFVIAVLLVLVVLGAMTTLSRRKAGAALAAETRDNSVPTVSVIHARAEAKAVEFELPGNIQAYEETPLYARVNGYLKRWQTDIGARVQAGDLLAEIETPELDQELNQARAALAQANANLEIARISADRWQNLRKSDAVSQQDTDVKVATYAARKADVNAQEANVQRLTEMTKFKKLVAPFDGTVTVRTVDVGTLITAGSGREIFRLARIDPLRVYISLPQAYSQMVAVGNEAVLRLAELPRDQFTGKVVRTAGAIDPVSRTLLTEVDVANHDGRLLPGAHAMVRVKLTSGEDPVIVPINTLIYRDENGTQVGVVDSNGVVSLRNVTIGRDFGTSVEIVQGLTPAENVIVNPSDSLEANTHVRVSNPPGGARAKPANE